MSRKPRKGRYLKHLRRWISNTVLADERFRSQRDYRDFDEKFNGCRCDASSYLYRGYFCPSHHDDPRSRESVAAVNLE